MKDFELIYYLWSWTIIFIILTLYTSLIVQSLRITDFIFASISHKVNMFSLKLEVKNMCIIFIDLNPQGSLPTTSPMLYFKLPYIGHYSAITQNFIKRNRNDLDIKLVFSSFKISNLFGMKNPVPDGLCSHVVYKFVCAGCNACYISETCRHFSTHVREH